MKEKKTRKAYRLDVGRNWDGGAALPDERARIAFWLDDGEIAVHVEAPFHDDPAPSGPAGEKEGLWSHEVVELFLLGKNGRYLEIELGPHGHHLILSLHGIRQTSGRLAPAHCTTRIDGLRWRGFMKLKPDTALLPFTHVNGYAMHGEGKSRRYLAASPVPGEHPDFHQPARFIPLEALT
ncbi:hypothetical protein CHL67_02865 [Prosthecochloris sp. GSB1]|uniref:hypothetical protein n=1 Tax=Prosthecochloris sp. GSB1 TaxID=281093 RepID=UPI000B8CEF1F|nr:hypothetical protein [Prosthecochloris sp. GSB1]ASQ91589.1 hypothetical protein CHL67_02865 [Prosthecochloris sp. GSB1]